VGARVARRFETGGTIAGALVGSFLDTSMATPTDDLDF
jgi:hypothetical protein